MTDEQLGSALSAPHAVRCLQHPARPAHDRCPRCARPRCATDAVAEPDGCAGCRVRLVPPVVDVDVLPAVVRAAVAASPAALVGALISYNYVATSFFSWFVPGLAGLVLGSLAHVSARPRTTGARWCVRSVCAGYAVLVVCYALRFAGIDIGGVGQWGPPVLAAVVGAALGEAYVAPPRSAAARAAHESAGAVPVTSSRRTG